MKKFLLGSVGLAAMLVGPAMAADMRVPPPAPPPPAYYDWTGAYIGANVGETWYQVDRTFNNNRGQGGFGPGPAGNFSTSDSDGIVGFHAGAQWQWGAWVLGAEAAYSGCFTECRSFTGTLATGPAGAPLFTPNTSAQHKITNLFTAGPRLGYAWDRWMIFATGGWASANLKGTYCSTITGQCDAGFTVQNGQTRNSGWYAGGGFDYMVHKGSLVDVILGVEYQHYDVGTTNATLCLNPACTPTGADYSLGAKGDLVRARLTIKTQGYGWLGAGPAPVY
jgi:outer membrane immunogenic protein